MSCPSSIRCWDSNPQPLKHESSAIITRPGLNSFKLFNIITFSPSSFGLFDHFLPSQLTIEEHFMFLGIEPGVAPLPGFQVVKAGQFVPTFSIKKGSLQLNPYFYTWVHLMDLSRFLGPSQLRQVTLKFSELYSNQGNKVFEKMVLTSSVTKM